MFTVCNYKRMWCLCLGTDGPLFTGAEVMGQWISFSFPSKKACTKCADELNSKFWPEYKTFLQGKDAMSDEIRGQMVEVIKQYTRN